MKNYIIAGALFLVLSVSSLFLPTSIMKWQDEQRTRESETEEVQEVVLKEQISMTLTEKLMFREQDTINTLALVNGKNYTKDTVVDQMRKEIEILSQKEILMNFDVEALEIIETNLLFFVDMEDSERSIMLWEGYANTSKYHVIFQMDDETGKIVSFSQYYDGPADFIDEYTNVSSVGMSVASYPLLLGVEELKEMAERWGEYLECRVSDSHSSWTDVGFDEDGQVVKRIETMMSKGYSYEEAERMVALELGVDTLGTWDTERLLAVLEDEGGQIGYGFYPEGEVIRVEPYLL